MGYKSAANVLPVHLVSEIQKYIDGEYLYIPSRERKAWGSKNGAKEKLAQRDSEIYQDHRNGADLEALSKKYCISIKAVEKVLTAQRKQEV
ncbi:MAG TPA: hypothetical protein H9761_01490 [Candidatus Eisenbergiella merdavium]|uniref:Mor transcription activator domain-containing protein n=1 Tax=Candidatus Eisenbergiella merdavium TaxID=2838551 RepID=A0A9D2NBH0_9FIRM|nr:hypothetical protein [Candidatus Eisenbergiella merdavium]